MIITEEGVKLEETRKFIEKDRETIRKSGEPAERLQSAISPNKPNLTEAATASS